MTDSQKYSRCAFQLQEGGIEGEFLFPDCMGERCSAFIIFSSTCGKSFQKVKPNPLYITNPYW